MTRQWFEVSILVLMLAACGPTALDTVCTNHACPAPAAPACNGTTLVVTDSGACTDDNGEATCNYPTEMTDCSATGMVCAMGACVAPADPCATATCNTPPDPSCADTVLTTYASAGTCDGSSGTAVCSYAPTTNDCADAGEVCQDGACFDACVGATCNTPPDATCTANTLTTYAATGSCDGSTGDPVCSYSPTQTDCTATDQICSGGACVDPCVPNPCDAPPPDTCVDGETQAHHADPGTCTSPAGVVACDYAVTDVDCSATNQACSAGACVDPCIGFTCDTPPATACVGTVIESFAAAGTCASPAACRRARTPRPTWTARSPARPAAPRRASALRCSRASSSRRRSSMCRARRRRSTAGSCARGDRSERRRRSAAGERARRIRHRHRDRSDDLRLYRGGSERRLRAGARPDTSRTTTSMWRRS